MAHPADRSGTERWVQDQGWQLLHQAQDPDPGQRRNAVVSLDPLLARVRSAEVNPQVYARLLRIGVLVRQRAADPAYPVEPLLADLLKYATRHELVDFEACAHALRGQAAIHAGHLDMALEAAANALVTLDNSRSSLQRSLALSDVGILLVHLGLEELAEPVLADAHTDVTAHGSPRHILITVSHRTHTALVRTLNMEHTAPPGQAEQRYRAAAIWALQGLRDWERACRAWPLTRGDVRTDADVGGEPADEYTSDLYAALALAATASARPDSPADVTPEARTSLQGMLPRLRRSDRALIAAIALSRLLDRIGDRRAALKVVRRAVDSAGVVAGPAWVERRRSDQDDGRRREDRQRARSGRRDRRRQQPGQRGRAPPKRGAESERQLHLAAMREIVALEVGLEPTGDGTDSLRDYLQEVEFELAAMRRFRAEALATQLVYERLRREHGRLSAEATRDPLTGLANRRAMQEWLDDLCRIKPAPTDSGPVHDVAVALLDLDGLKRVNDIKSHAAGDEVLRAVAAVMSATLRSDDLIARYGGDEFVVVMPRTRTAEALAAMQRLVDAVAGLPLAKVLGVTVSAGVACAPAGASVDAYRMLRAADGAMYRAKQAGGNRVVVARA